MTHEGIGEIAAIMALAAKLSRDGWKGCKERGDVENCLVFGCPCGAAAMALVHGQSTQEK